MVGLCGIRSWDPQPLGSRLRGNDGYAKVSAGGESIPGKVRCHYHGEQSVTRPAPIRWEIWGSAGQPLGSRLRGNDDYAKVSLRGNDGCAMPVEGEEGGALLV